MPGTAAILPKWRWPTRRRANGGIAPSSSRVARLDYRLIKELWGFRGNRMAVRFAYEWHDDSGNWFRSYGNENWEFDERGLMQRGSPASMMLRSAMGNVSFIGPLADVPTTTPN